VITPENGIRPIGGMGGGMRNGLWVDKSVLFNLWADAWPVLHEVWNKYQIYSAVVSIIVLVDRY
jgi:hypothetical protein